MRSTTAGILGATARAAMLAAFAAAAGCSDTDRATNNFHGVRGNSTRDTIDLNISTDAFLSELSFRPPIFPVGPGGEVVAHILQVHAGEPDSFNESFDEFRNAAIGGSLASTPFNYYRVLGDGPGPIGELDNHADPDYDPFAYIDRAVSPSKQFTALLRAEEADGDLALVVFDSQTGTYTTEVDIFDAQSGAFSFFNSEEAMFVDNTGRVTVLFFAAAPATQTATLFACQFDAPTATIVRQPTSISSPNVSFRGAKQAVNGDIAILTTFDPSTLESIVYDRSSDTFGAPATVATGSVGQVVLDTDGSSFQVAFANAPVQVSEVFTSRFVAELASQFPAPTSLGTGSSGIDVNFGREGTSIVHWVEPPGKLTASWSATTVTPSAAETVLLLSGFGTSVRELDYAFDDAGNALIWYISQNGAGQSELYVNTLDRAAGAIAQVTSGTDNLATEAQPGDGLSIGDAEFLGYSGGGGPTCVLYWDSSRTPGGQGAAESRLNAVLFTGLARGARTELQTRTDFPIDDFVAASANDAKTSVSYIFQYDALIDPDSLPATGDGTSWVVWRQFKPLAGGSGYFREYAWSFTHGQGALTGAAQGGVLEFGKFGNVQDIDADIQALCPNPAGGASVFLRQFDVDFRFNLSPSPGAGQPPATDPGAVITPVDLTRSLISGGIHIDGLGFTFNDAGGGNVSKAARGGGRIWSFWIGFDIESLRVFAKRTR